MLKHSLALVALLILLSACAANPGQPAHTSIADAHGAGNVVQFNQD